MQIQEQGLRKKSVLVFQVFPQVGNLFLVLNVLIKVRRSLTSARGPIAVNIPLRKAQARHILLVARAPVSVAEQNRRVQPDIRILRTEVSTLQVGRASRMT